MAFTYLGEWTGFRIKFTTPEGSEREEVHLHGHRFLLYNRVYAAGHQGGGGVHFGIWEEGKHYLI